MSPERALCAVALGLTLAVGCYSSGGQTKDGQSHWLERCSTQADCNDDQLCACGVCTIACEDSESCGASATCEPVEAREACDGTASGTDSVCLQTCANDATCEDSQLSCVSEACVASTLQLTEEPDAATPMSEDGLRNACDNPEAREPLVVRDGETCFDLLMHNGDGVTPFEVAPDEALHQTYYAVPWPADSIATRFGFQQDDTTSLHRALLFEALGGPDGTLERNVTGDLTAQEAELLAAWSVGGCNVELPSEMGIELVDPEDRRSLMIQWHYYNTTGQSQRDSSRFQVCVVPRTSRPFTGSMIVLGSENLGGLEGMPAGQESTFEGECINEDNDEEDGSPDFTFVTYLPHMHALGTRSRIEYDSQSQSGPITVLDRAFGHEENVHYASPPRTVLAYQRSFRTSCTYFNDRNYSAPYGTSLVFEQCYVFAYGYPAGALDKPDEPSFLGVTNTCLGN